MSRQLSKWWLLGPPFAITVSVLAYYAMFPSFRRWVDTRFPWAALHIGIYLPRRDGDDQSERMRSAVMPADRTPPINATSVPISPTRASPPVPAYVTAEGILDLAKLSANRADWPKAVVLRKAKEFPAVVDGKSVGKITVPKDTEVHLLKIEVGKLGLEYRGGGVWADADETDLAERLRTRNEH